MFVTQGQTPQTVTQPQITNTRQTRDQQKKAFHEILAEANELKDDQLLQKISNDLEEEAFVQSKGENTREYRTRVNTVKMRIKGIRGKQLRQLLYDNVLTASELMKMDMMKLTEETIQQYLKDNNKLQSPSLPDPAKNIVRPPAQTRPTLPVQRPGPPQIGQRQLPPKIQDEPQSAPKPQQIIPQPQITTQSAAQDLFSDEINDSEFDPPKEDFLEDLSGAPPLGDKEDQNFLQMQKNIEGMKKLAEQLDQEFEEEYQEDQEQSAEDVGPYKEYTEGKPLASDNALNQEFIKDDPQEQSMNSPGGDLLDQEIREQEQDYYLGDEQNLDYDQEEVQQELQVPFEPVQTQAFKQQNIQRPTTSEIQPSQQQQQQQQYQQQQLQQQQQFPSVQKPQSQPQVNQIDQVPPNILQPQPSSAPQVEALDLKLSPTVKPTVVQKELPRVAQDNTQNFLNSEGDHTPNQNQVTQAVFDKLIQQRDQFYEQQLLEQQKLNQHLQNEIHQIMQVSSKQLNVANQKNQQLQQSNSMLKAENQAVKEELSNIRNQFTQQLNNLQQAFDSERQGWNEEREVLLNIQQSPNFEEEIDYLQNEQNQLANMLTEYQKKSRDKNESIVNLLKSRSTDVDKFNENLNQFRLLLIKLHPNTQWKASESNLMQSSQEVKLPTNRLQNSQKQQTTQHQLVEPEIQRNVEPIRQQQVEIRSVQNPEPRIIQHDDQQNRYGDSGSTQTLNQNYFEEGKQANRRNDDQDQLFEGIQEISEVEVQVVLPPPPKRSQAQLQNQTQPQHQQPAQQVQLSQQVFGHPKLMNKKPQNVPKTQTELSESAQIFGQSSSNLFDSQPHLQWDEQEVHSLQSSQAFETQQSPVQVQKIVNPPVVQQFRPQQAKQSKRQQVPGQLFD